jgi:hypothetical protein
MKCYFVNEPEHIYFEKYRLTVVIDLDETMGCFRKEDLIRPGINKFLEEIVNANIEIICWTAGTRDHARKALNILDEKNFISQCICRGKWFEEYYGAKPTILLDRTRTIILDNSPLNIVHNTTEGIVIGSYFSEYDHPFPETLSCILVELKQSNDSVSSFLNKKYLEEKIKKDIFFCSSLNLEMYHMIELNKFACEIALPTSPCMKICGLNYCVLCGQENVEIKIRFGKPVCFNCDISKY